MKILQRENEIAVKIGKNELKIKMKRDYDAKDKCA